LRNLILSTLLIASFSLVGCGSSSSKPKNNLETNSTKRDTKSVYPKVIRSGEVVSLEYLDKSVVSYTWRDQNGKLLGHSSKIEWTAPSKSGTYVISVDTVNDKGELSTGEIQVKVVDHVDDEAPFIELKGASKIELELGQNYEELGADAYDDEDGDISDKVMISGNVDTSLKGVYKVNYSVEDSYGNRSEISRTVVVKDTGVKYNVPAHAFDDIKAFLLASKKGEVADATYICLGDSTRAVSDVQNSQRYFNHIRDALKDYNVNSILEARGSHMLKEFLDESEHPTLGEVIDDIPNDGSSTILDLSLGVNDLFHENDLHESEGPFAFTTHKDEYKKIVKGRLKKAINKIRAAKPNTSIFLVTPNPTRDWEGGTHFMLNIYKEVSRELNLPLADFVDERMHGGDTESGDYDDWYRDGIHFSDKALDKLASYVLSKILPN